MKHLDILRDKAFWGGLLGTARQQATGERAHDHTHLAQFADWLQERGDPRHMIVARAKDLDQFGHFPGALGLFTAHHQPASAYNINAHTGVYLNGRDVHRGSDEWDHMPTLSWVAHVPRTQVGGRAMTASYHAPVSVPELWEFIEALPANKRPQWEKSARANDWHRPPKTKLARTVYREPGPAAAIRDRNSENAVKRSEIAKQILREAGLNPSTVREAIEHEGDKAVASAVQVIRRNADPAHVRYAAAWYGLLSQSPAVTVFHPTRTGEDTLHVISSPHASDHVIAYLKRAGVPKFTTESINSGKSPGTRAYIFDPGSRLPGSQLASGLNASHSPVRGVGFKLGDRAGSGADSRAAYRDAIRQFERAAGTAPAV